MSKRKWTHIGCGAAFGLILLLGACTAVLFAVVDDTPPEQAQKKEEPTTKETGADPKTVSNIENAFESHKIVVSAMNKIRKQAENGDEEKAKEGIASALMMMDLPISLVSPIEGLEPLTEEEKELAIYQTDIAAAFQKYRVIIEGMKQGIDEGLTVEQAFSSIYDAKAGDVLSKIDKLEKRLEDFK